MIIRTNITISFLALCVFMLSRPIVAMSYFDSHSIFGLKYLELFTICMSYGFIILILPTLKKQTLDGASIFLLLFCLYCGLSLMWGSDVRQVSRLILPAVFFFSTRVIVEEEKQIERLLLLAILGSVVPILGSAYLIIHHKMNITVYWTGLNRYYGMYSGIHGLAHSMFIFLFFAMLYLYFREKTDRRRTTFLYLVYFLCLIAVFDLLKTYTRNVFIGFYILLFCYLIGRRNYKLLLAITLGSILVAINSSTFWEMIYDFVDVFQGKRDLVYMGSGRIGIWTRFLGAFFDLPFPNQVLGAGVTRIAASHNDFLSLMFSFGVVGFFIYVSFIMKVFFDILKSCIERKLKYTFLGFMLAVFAMNFASNSYISRVELAQYFFLVIGVFYSLQDTSLRENQT